MQIVQNYVVQVNKALIGQAVPEEAAVPVEIVLGTAREVAAQVETVREVAVPAEIALGTVPEEAAARVGIAPGTAPEAVAPAVHRVCHNIHHIRRIRNIRHIRYIRQTL